MKIDEGEHAKWLQSTGAKFTVAEIKDLLDVVEHIFPVTGGKWTTVATMHAEKWPQNSRTIEGLYRKFHNLWKLAPATSDLSCPPHVKRAKRINRMIAGGAGIGEDIDDDLDFSDESLQIFTDRIAPSGRDAT